jgi:hypothetical protein
VLRENDSVNVVMSCYRDLNRSFMKEAANEKSPDRSKIPTTTGFSIGSANCSVA